MVCGLRALVKRYGISQKTVAKWKGRDTVADRPAGPKEPKSTVLSDRGQAHERDAGVHSSHELFNFLPRTRLLVDKVEP